MTHWVLAQYYPSLVTQIIIGCTCYIILLFAIKDFINDYDSLMYYALALVLLDVSFLISVIHKKQPVYHLSLQLNQNIQPDQIESSETDYRITHDLTLTDTNTSIFSTSNTI